MAQNRKPKSQHGGQNPKYSFNINKKTKILKQFKFLIMKKVIFLFAFVLAVSISMAQNTPTPKWR